MNESEKRTCPECGAELDAAAPDQPCPACLMQLGLDSWANQQGDSAAPGPTHLTGQEFVPPSIDELSERLPNLEVLELLGQGGMGADYKARQTSLDRIVALKLIRPDAVEVQDFAERFTREARALARLNHPSIVTIHDFGEIDGLYYLVMEFVDGTTLRELIESGTLEPQQALEIVPAICEALQYAHDAGIVHRDIKPANILIDTNGRVKIADFGLARLTGGDASAFTLTGTRQVMGTPRYMAPEQMEGSHNVDHRADISSLGVVFYEMLTGEVPLGHFEPPSKKVEVDVRLDEVVLRSLAREPERRYQQASDVKSDVEAVANSQYLPSLKSSQNLRPGDDGPISPLSIRQPFILDLVCYGACLSGTATVMMRWAMIGQKDIRHTWWTEFAGTQGWPAIAAAATFVAIGLFLLATESIKPTPVWRGIVAIGGGALALLFTCLFVPVVSNARVGLFETEWHLGMQLSAFMSVIVMCAGPGLVRFSLALREASRRDAEKQSGDDRATLAEPVASGIVESSQRDEAHSAQLGTLGRSLLQWAMMLGVVIGGSWLVWYAMTSGGSHRNSVQSESDSGPPNSDPGFPERKVEIRPLPEMQAAARAGQIGRVRQLLKKDGIDINDKDAAGKTALMYAAENGQVSTVLVLIVLGANAEEPDDAGQNAVMHAGANGHGDVLKAMHDLEIFAAVCHRDQASPELAAERFKEFPGIDRRILDGLSPRTLKFEVPFETQDGRGETVMMKIAAAGHIECLSVMHNIEGYMTFDVQDKFGRTVLMHALLNGHTKLLLKEIKQLKDVHWIGYSGVHKVDHEGRTLLMLAEEMNQKEVAIRLREKLNESLEWYTDGIKKGRTRLLGLSYLYGQRSNLWRALGEFEKANADLELSKDSTMQSANTVVSLHAAAAAGEVAQVKQMVEIGAVDINATDDDRQTALMKAAAAGQTRMVAFLLAVGALPDAQDKSGQTALMLAAGNSHSKTVQTILLVCQLTKEETSAGSRVSVLSQLAGISLKVSSTSKTMTGVVTAAIQFDEDIQDAKGETALMKAASAGDAASVISLAKSTRRSISGRPDRSDKRIVSDQARPNHIEYFGVTRYLDAAQ